MAVIRSSTKKSKKACLKRQRRVCNSALNLFSGCFPGILVIWGKFGPWSHFLWVPWTLAQVALASSPTKKSQETLREKTLDWCPPLNCGTIRKTRKKIPILCGQSTAEKSPLYFLSHFDCFFCWLSWTNKRRQTPACSSTLLFLFIRLLLFFFSFVCVFFSSHIRHAYLFMCHLRARLGPAERAPIKWEALGPPVENETQPQALQKWPKSIKTRGPLSQSDCSISQRELAVIYDAVWAMRTTNICRLAQTASLIYQFVSIVQACIFPKFPIPDP